MDNNSTIGQLFEQGKAVVDDGISDVATTTKKQVLGDNNSTQNQNTAQNISDSSSPSGEANSTPDTMELVGDFYAPSNDSKFKTAVNMDDPNELQKVRQKLQEEKSLYHQLHKDVYYDPLFAYENKKPEPTKADEQEQEEQQKMQSLATEQKKKDEDIALHRAQASIETRVSAG